jgi:cell wall-associated NlpC family hydrolase
LEKEGKMGKKIIHSIVLAGFFISLVTISQPGRAQYLADNNCNTPANLCKDSCAAENTKSELEALSDKLGVKLDSTCDIKLMAILADWLGTPYRHAGYSKAGIDCSGFVSKIYKEAYGIDLTHSSRSMIYQMKERVKKSELSEGDILFFRIHGKRISHVGIYLKDGYFIHAASGGITVENLESKYYKRVYYTAGRPNCSNRLASN